MKFYYESQYFIVIHNIDRKLIIIYNNLIKIDKISTWLVHYGENRT